MVILASIFKKKEKVRLKSDTPRFFKKLQIKFVANKQKLINKLKNSNEFNIFIGDAFEIIMVGALLNLALTLLGINFKVVTMFAIGAGWFILSKKILPELKSILSSISLVKINN